MLMLIDIFVGGIFPLILVTDEIILFLYYFIFLNIFIIY